MKLIQTLNTAFIGARNQEIALAQAAYMKNQFPFLGIKTPDRRQLQKEILAGFKAKDEKELLEVAQQIWKMEEREFQYAALEVLERQSKLLTPFSLPVLEQFIRNKSWWDTVDFLAANLIGGVVAKNLTLLDTMDQWIEDENFWIRRSALLSQLKWKKKTDMERLFRYCTLTMHEKEFFIRKAVGWVLREYSKTDVESVRAFVHEYADQLSGVSMREATKYL